MSNPFVQRVAHWLELDAAADDDDERLYTIHTAAPMRHAARPSLATLRTPPRSALSVERASSLASLSAHPTELVPLPMRGLLHLYIELNTNAFLTNLQVPLPMRACCSKTNSK